MADTFLRGTISVMTGSDPSSGDPIYKGLYPKTITDQVIGLDTYVDSAIEKLISQGYLNDQNFAKSYIHSQMNTTNHGPNRIRNDLANKHVSAILFILSNNIPALM